MKNEVYTKIPGLIFLFTALVAMYIYVPVQNDVKAYENSVQDTTKRGDMKHAGHGSMGGMKADMRKMHKNMMNMEMTGDADYDFASMMIEHHKGAIKMSETEVGKGKDPQVKSMAEKLIADQKSEIDELQTFLKDKPAMNNLTSFSKDMTEKMNGMNQKMQTMEMKGDQDQDFASMMVMHHQQAIDMSEHYLSAGKNESLKEMAGNIIDKNKEEINRLKNWQNNYTELEEADR